VIRLTFLDHPKGNPDTGLRNSRSRHLGNTASWLKATWFHFSEIPSLSAISPHLMSLSQPKTVVSRAFPRPGLDALPFLIGPGGIAFVTGRVAIPECRFVRVVERHPGGDTAAAQPAHEISRREHPCAIFRAE
jgi:hypothetical protein